MWHTTSLTTCRWCSLFYVSLRLASLKSWIAFKLKTTMLFLFSKLLRCPWTRTYTPTRQSAFRCAICKCQLYCVCKDGANKEMRSEQPMMAWRDAWRVHQFWLHSASYLAICVVHASLSVTVHDMKGTLDIAKHNACYFAPGLGHHHCLSSKVDLSFRSHHLLWKTGE